MEGATEHPDLEVTHCVICSARHVQAVADPGKMITRGAPLG
jgi:hypothetical protein